MNILVTMPVGGIRDSFFDERAKKRLERLGHVVYNPSTKQFTKEELAERLKTADIVVTGWGTAIIDKAMVRETPLQLIVHTGGSVGLVIDMDIYETDVKIISGNDYYAESVAEGVLSYMLFMLRKLDYYSANLKQGNWLADNEGGTEGVLDQSVGIVSLGTISRHLIRMLKPFRADVKVFSTRPNAETARELGFTYASLEDIFTTCKIVSVHTASNEKTRHMINRTHFRMLKKGAIFINTSRGAVIDEDALITALENNTFRALLDVYQVEPLPKDSALLKLPNVSLFPHQAGPTVDRRAPITHFLIDDLENFIHGRSLKNEITADTARSMTK